MRVRFASSRSSDEPKWIHRLGYRKHLARCFTVALLYSMNFSPSINMNDAQYECTYGWRAGGRTVSANFLDIAKVYRQPLTINNLVVGRIFAFLYSREKHGQDLTRYNQMNCVPKSASVSSLRIAFLKERRTRWYLACR